MKKASLILPLTLIIIGMIGFLRETNILPSAATAMAILLIIIGFTVFILEGFNRQSIITAPTLIYSGIATYLVSRDILTLSALVALGMVIIGLLLLIVRSKFPFEED